ncbi:alpha-glucosidase [Fomitiporia mediterranea MF3/22]|uniref:alpha-glucosidase n=1 Tax=Fomitiporia mediterranea (strain MF3/22) TaxID=694068 RepID=UPI0004409391|nr:alpha-glucosidase [Fomitiporia mediterranea MF3/22]EJD08185.1 alpha-glucosidase [Fomitiporia mediterranea MF3/22]
MSLAITQSVVEVSHEEYVSIMEEVPVRDVWRTPSDSAFCRRGQAIAARAKKAGSHWKSPYSIDRNSISVSPKDASFSATINSSIYPDIEFKLDMQVFQDGVVRVRMDEIDGLRKRYDEAASWALATEPKVNNEVQWCVGKKEAVIVTGEHTVVVELSPLKILLLRKGKEEIVLNGGGLLHMEHFRSKEELLDDSPREDSKEAEEAGKSENPAAWFEGEEDGWWEEKFESWVDKKPKGPESLSLDIDFPNHGHLYGIPQHATHLDLPTTTGNSPTYESPYRLMNADSGRYETSSSTMSLYGSVPLLYAHSSSGSTVGVFHVVGSETWIDVAHPRKDASHTHWISESGILDTLLLPGPTPEAVAAQYARLTGTPVLPAQWALGYHQCRWSYMSSKDVLEVQQRFDKDEFPVDAIWLDIDYATEHRYFIWEKKRFPDPVEMIKEIEAAGRKMVVIVDPHLKREKDYPIYKEAYDLGILVKESDRKTDYEGQCWPGLSSWVDFFHPGSRDWWKKHFKTSLSKDGAFTWIESTENVGIWNDMNEPAVFDAPEKTLPKDCVHYGGWEHRDIHNIYGMLLAGLTWQGLHERLNPPKRPFVLSRSFFAGSQKFGATWTGDNSASWEHMEVGLKMVLANGLGGMSFAGADVGGFFDDPEPEMLVRWYQLGAFFPFFRAHAHKETKRREPYLLNEPYKSIVRDALHLRYKLLPVWYTAFRETSVTGSPVLRPQFFACPCDEKGASLDDQFYVGSSGLLVKPVTSKGAEETTVYLSNKQPYYDYFTNHIHRGGQKNITVKAELDQIPIFIQGGSIIPTRERPRRASPLMKNDPFTLRVALDTSCNARGELYLDDGESYSHERGELVWREFSAEAGAKGNGLVLRSTDLAFRFPEKAVRSVSLNAYNPVNNFAKSIRNVEIEDIFVLGLLTKPASVKTGSGEGRELEWEFVEGLLAKGGKEGKEASVLRITKPGAGVACDWEICIQ